MASIPPGSGFVAPDYDPSGDTRPKKVHWRRSNRVPDWIKQQIQSRQGPPDLREIGRWTWSDPVWIWCEGRDGVFLLSSSFVILDMGYWSGQEWRARGTLYLYLATHAYVQLFGPEALSLTPPHKLNELAQVLSPDWVVGIVRYSGVSERTTCYEAPVALPWESLVGTVTIEIPPGDKRQAEKRAQIEDAAQRFYRAHESRFAARSTFERLLQAAEDGPCEAANISFSGWWNENMIETFRRQAKPLGGQADLFDTENWQEFTVDKDTGEWIPLA